MNKGTASEASALITELLAEIESLEGVEVIVCPPYTALASTKVALGNSTKIALGAQDVFWKATGAYTGQVSAGMLKDIGVQYVIIGHSEARGRFGVPEPDFDEAILQHFGDTDSSVNRKARAALEAGLIPIICVGETLQEREDGNTDLVIREQLHGALAGFNADQLAESVLAYEPVWAIGTGRSCDASEADRVCGYLRFLVGEMYGSATAEAVRVQYGGSMKPDNAGELLSKPDIDGGLIGGASLKASDFAAIIRTAANP